MPLLLRSQARPTLWNTDTEFPARERDALAGGSKREQRAVGVHHGLLAVAHKLPAACRMDAFVSPGPPRPCRIAGAAPAFHPSRPHPRALAAQVEPTARLIAAAQAISARFEASSFGTVAPQRSG